MAITYLDREPCQRLYRAVTGDPEFDYMRLPRGSVTSDCQNVRTQAHQNVWLRRLHGTSVANKM